jgi:hypothetical protein
MGVGYTGGPWNSDSLHHWACQWSDKLQLKLKEHATDARRTTSPIPSREVGALFDFAAEVPSGIVLSVDQIDDRTDTFRPFVPDKAEAGATPEAFLFVINAPLRYIHNIFSWK